MRNIKDFIYYYRSCPLCDNWMTLDVDLPIPTTLEIMDDRLVFTIIGKKGLENKQYDIMFKQNKVVSKHNLILGDIVSLIQRLYNPNYKTKFKIEARCYACNNFRYWSKMMLYNEKTKRITNIGVSGERVQFHELNPSNEKISYILSNNCNIQETEAYVLKQNIKGKIIRMKLPYMPFKKLNFEKKQLILEKLQKLSLLA